MIIRRATTGDLDGIRVVGERTWPPTYEFAGADYITRGLATWWSWDALHKSLSDCVNIVADDGGEIIGMAMVDLSRAVPVLWKLYVLPERHGGGVGSALLDAVFEALPAGVDRLRLDVLDGNTPAQRFYAARGFVEVDREAASEPCWPATVWMERPVGVH